MMESPFILTMPILAKKAETEVTSMPAEMLIWQNKEICKEALIAFKEDIRFLATEGFTHSVDSKKLVIEFPNGILFEYDKYDQAKIDDMIEYLSNEKFNQDKVYKLQNKEKIMKKALACLVRKKLIDDTFNDVNTEMALIYAL